jgi:geranylgeranyl pyrophosphate synthase
MRSAFYTVSPIAAIGKYSEASPAEIARVQSSLQRMNRAGQMINDLQDFDESGARSRTSSFSDIRNGVSSVPIRHIWQTISERDRERFLSVHGKANLTDADTDFIRRLTAGTELGHAMQSLIDAEYLTARDEYIDALDPSPATLTWVDAWLDYKRDQARVASSALSDDCTPTIASGVV